MVFIYFDFKATLSLSRSRSSTTQNPRKQCVAKAAEERAAPKSHSAPLKKVGSRRSACVCSSTTCSPSPSSSYTTSHTHPLPLLSTPHLHSSGCSKRTWAAVLRGGGGGRVDIQEPTSPEGQEEEEGLSGGRVERGGGGGGRGQFARRRRRKMRRRRRIEELRKSKKISLSHNRFHKG